MTPDQILTLSQLVAGALYAVVLEVVFRRRYEPAYTWVTVVGGTLIVAGLVALRLLLAPLPALDGADLAWWVWWAWAWSFAANGLPIIAWQLTVRR